ncbi:hypothetical protein F5X99DRAFT_384021 [Biscogniauxia marginata]|nr:hypothetical protein F5X99DRAFT_384021 [Biscogniauxia marginata]
MYVMPRRRGEKFWSAWKIFFFSFSKLGRKCVEVRRGMMVWFLGGWKEGRRENKEFIYLPPTGRLVQTEMIIGERCAVETQRVRVELEEKNRRVGMRLGLVNWGGVFLGLLWFGSTTRSVKYQAILGTCVYALAQRRTMHPIHITITTRTVTCTYDETNFTFTIET